MDPRNVVLSLACALLLITGCIYGFKFLKKRNYLLGLEWLVVAFSATNFLAFFLTGSETAYYISYFCDAFSRGFGIPIIAILGLMAVTHGYKPSILVDIVAFVLAIAGTFGLILSEFMTKPLPYFYVAMWTLFSIYLAYFAKKLLTAGATGHAITVVVALVAGQTIACIYDFYKIPGDDTNILFNFYVLALGTWSFLIAVSYHAYCALERATTTKATPVGAMPGLAAAANDR